jgi:phage FluMu gp28-like protein
LEAVASRSVSELSPEEFAVECLFIMNKDDEIVPFIWNDIQREYHVNRTPRDIILKPRQIGFSTYVQGELYRYATTGTARTLTLADSDDNTQKLRRLADRFYQYTPDQYKPKRALNNATITTYKDYGSEAMIASAGNRGVGRAGSYRYIHLSEAAFYPDLQKVLSSATQGGRPQWIVIESTPNGAQGKFYELCMEALRGDGIWKLHFYTWFDFAEYQLPLNTGEKLVYTDEEAKLVKKHNLTQEQIKWRRFKHLELGSAREFQQEYAEDPVSCFLSSGAQVFGDFKVYSPKPNAKPIEGHEYYAGGDWGQSNDYSSLSIIDATDNQEVYLNRWRRMPWLDIRREILDACEYWKVLKFVPERNAASSNIEDISAEAYRRKMQMSIAGFTMSNKSKGELINHFNHALHEEGLELLDIPYATAEMRQFTTRQTDTGLWVYSHPGGEDGHGDTTIARLLAWRACMNRVRDYS